MVDKAGRDTLERLKRVERELAISPEALFEHPELARQVFEAVSDAIIISDPDSVIKLVNRQTERMFCYSRAELIGQNVRILMPEEYRSRHAAKQDSYFRDPHVRSFEGEFLEGLRRTGERFQVMIALHPIVSSRGTFVMATLREKGHDEPVAN